MAKVRLGVFPIGWLAGWVEYSPTLRQNGVWLQSMGLFTRSQVTPELARQARDILIEAQRISVFYGTPLQLILRSLGIETLIMAGLTTTGVVLSSLAYASERQLPDRRARGLLLRSRSHRSRALVRQRVSNPRLDRIGARHRRPFERLTSPHDSSANAN